ncbi:MAG: DEAD/DEAH box helicase family protein [Bacteroidetes bacterium]|uniref:DEAD/DEAH box helicase family protein n=1 Tax=Candidatus Gallipaludibacter merdavium TaxID=2840839 RepID=A0A9D9N3I9_9BACT|nr:DEAD/DEAH box helicase family protein [Candidatus Gallipaludibacter merdavium]
MKKIILPINRGQRLSDIYTIEKNTILCKTLTGLGATYSEIKAKRHSIIIELNQPPIVGKCKDPKHKKDNLFGVMQKVTVDDVIEYLEDTIANGKLIKILCTPESFYKVKQSFEYLELNMYTMCFMLLDECHKLVKDNDYREDITLPIDDFFHFDKKAMVSATPIIPSDPRFEEQGFMLVEVKPSYNYTKAMNIVHTNNVLEALKVTLPKIKQAQEEPRSICFFINSTDMIHQLMNKLNIIEDSAVFCSTKSVDKLKRNGFNHAYDNWNNKHKKPYMFFTSRFYSALDMELDEKPDIVFVTEPYFAEYTMIAPCTDAVQAIGRFRCGVSTIHHIVNTNESYPIRTKSGIVEYLKASRDAYKAIKNIYLCATSIEARNAFKAALDILPFNKMLKNGRTDYFAIDNYMDEALVKSSYNNMDSLMELYGKTNHFKAEISDSLFYPLGDKERLTLENKNTSIKESRKKLVEILESLKNDMDSPIIQTHIRELRRLDPFIVEAYEKVGKEVIEINNSSFASSTCRF